MLELVGVPGRQNDLVTTIGHPELADDPKYKDAAARFENRRECVAALDAIFAEKTFDEWRAILSNAEGVWEPVETPGELIEDEQALANGYVGHITLDNGTSFRIVPSPLQSPNQPVVSRNSVGGGHAAWR